MITGAIPLPGDPGQAFGKAFNGMDDFFQKIKQHQLEQQKLQELAKYHQADINLRKAAAGRAARAASLAERKEQPGYRVQKFLQERDMLRKALADRYPNMPGINNGMPANAGAQIPAGQPQKPSYGMGQGMMMPAGQVPAMGQDEQQATASIAPQTQQPEESGYNQQTTPQVDAYGIDWNNPIDAMVASNNGFKPPVQTPQQKENVALDLFQKKAAITAANKGGDKPTNTVLTQNQQAIQGIDTVLPMLDDLINNPSKVYGKYDFNQSKKAAYNAKTSGMIDTLVAAQSLPKVQASIDLVEQQIRRAPYEDDKAYIKRLKDLRNDLINRRGKAQSVIKNRKINTADLAPEEKTLNGKKYQKINGEWHEVE